MKKFVAITISLCLVFASVVPSYAAWGDVPTDRNYLRDIRDEITSLGLAFYGSLGTMYNSVSEFMSWITPSGSFSTSSSITEVTLYEIIDYIAWTLSGNGPTVYDNISSTASLLAGISGNLISFQTANNNHLDDLEIGLTNYFRDAQSVNVANRKLNTHTALVNSSLQYNVKNIGSNATITTDAISWLNGSPLGNIALILQRLNNSTVDGWDQRWSADLTHYNDTLSTWDSQQDTLTQVNFTPDSAIQGLYRYLAFTQRDVARLAYVMASDEEIEAREKSRDNQTEILDRFIDGNGEGAYGDGDVDTISGGSNAIKNNFNTGVNEDVIWSVFNSNRYSWFSNDTKNLIQPQTRSEYPTPLLDAYYSEMFSLFESEDENR